METVPPLPLTLSQAIARFEGWYAHGEHPNRGQRNFNPGNLNYGPLARRFGASLEDHEQPRFARFPTPDHGWNCLRALLNTPDYQRLTLVEAIHRYAPPVENDTERYVNQICEWMHEGGNVRVCEVMI